MLEARHGDLFAVLGPHKVGGGIVIRTFVPSEDPCGPHGRRPLRRVRWLGRLPSCDAPSPGRGLELLLAELREGVPCKYEIRGADDMLLALKADPVGFAAVYQAGAASTMAKVDAFAWKDDERLFGARGAPPVTVASNFKSKPRLHYRLSLPKPGSGQAVLNTDAAYYRGSGMGNLGGIVSEPIPWHGRPYPALVTLPPLSTLFFVANDEQAA
ncbi:MAG TPA: alpha amylase C-terminal domain-containing protein [Geminicoccus sp.]|nr:alpha amylase C-terminal domain-containing protein [Geminicoccus sp.]